MKYLFGVSAALLVTTAPIQFAVAKDSPADLVKAAVTAEGGADALKALKGLAIKGEAKHWEPGQSLKAGGEPRFLGDTNFTATVDSARARRALDLDRGDGVSGGRAVKYTEVITPTMGFVTNARAPPRPPACGSRRSLRELERCVADAAARGAGQREEHHRRRRPETRQGVLPAVNYAENGDQVHHPVRSEDPSAGRDPHASTTTISPAIRTTTSC